MAHHKSAKKRVRQTLKRTEVNKARVSEVRTCTKAILAAVKNKDKETAAKLLPTAQSKLRKLAKIGYIKPNTASRKTGRLASQVNSL